LFYHNINTGRITLGTGRQYKTAKIACTVYTVYTAFTNVA